MDIGLLVRQRVQPLAEQDADRPAISLEQDDAWSYRQLDAYANRCSHTLLAGGVRPGDRVGLLLTNSPEYVGLYLGIVRIGAVAVRLNWRLTRAELAFAVCDAGCRLLLAHDDLAGLVEESTCAERIVVPRVAGPDPLLGAPSDPPEVAVPGSGDLAMIMYTSGTTGRPKGATWTHGASVTYAAMQVAAYGFDRRTVAMTTGPLFHVGSLENLLLPALMAGGRAVLTRSRAFEADRIVQVLERLAVTDALLQTSALYDVLASPAMAAPSLPALRTLFTGGTDVKAWAVAELSARLPHVAVCALYGLTEGGAVSTWERLSTQTLRPGSVGSPLPLTEVRLSPPGSAEPPLETDGEIWVRSGSSSTGYWERPEANAETFVDGWCRTGDLGRRSRDGRLVITGRTKDMVKSGGENVYPVEVEDVLLEHPGVADVAVIAVPDRTYVEAVCAVVVCVAGVTVDPEDLVRHCTDRLARYKKPRHVVFVADLPRSHTGKVQKQLLRETWAHLGEQVRP